MSKQKRNRAKKIKRIKEFRKERTREGEGHPRFFFKKIGRRLFGLGITHGERKDGLNTIKLAKNPEPHPTNKKAARIVPKIEEVPERYLSNRLIGWAFSEEDEKTVNDLIAELEKKQNK